MTSSESTRSAEVWAEIPSAPGYEVSNLGRVRSYRSKYGLREHPHMLSGYINNRGYVVVALRPSGHPRTVHSLVAEAFIGPRPPGMEVRHLNGDRSDPALSNLKYGTPQENQMDRVEHGTSNRGVRQHMNKLTEDDVRAIRRLARETEMFKKDICAMFGVSRTTVSSIIHGNNWGWLEDDKEVGTAGLREYLGVDRKASNV